MFTFKIENPDKFYMTSDTHFNHFNICKYCERPFETRKEMNDTLINNWNIIIPEDAIVVHCGDFALPHEHGDKEYRKFFEKLNFSVLILCRGNHDRIDCGTYVYGDKTVIVVDIAMLLVDGVKLMASHFPMLAYPADYQIFGHIHTLIDGTCHGVDGDVKERLRKTQYDVGVDQNNYQPLSYWQLCHIFRHLARN